MRHFDDFGATSVTGRYPLAQLLLGSNVLPEVGGV